MTSKINSIQALRAYAAISVMIGHAILEAYANWGITDHDFNEFPFIAGVDVFFLISGFIMYITSRDDFSKPGAMHMFLRRRLVRIVPLYWFFTSLMILTLLIVPGQVRTTELDLWSAITSYLFIPAERASGRVAPVLSLGWTLNYEMFFYLCFAACMLFQKKLGLLLLVLSFIIFSIIGAIVEIPSVALSFWTDSIVLEFVMGVLVATQFQKLRSWANLAFSIITFIAGFTLLLLLSNIDLEIPRFIRGGVPACLMLCGALLYPTKLDTGIPKFVLLLGDSSYALYLCHRFALRPLSILLGAPDIPLPLGIVIYVTLSLILAVISSILVHWFIELPMLRFFSRKFARRTKG